jgi:hypothetical protein
VIHHHGGYPGYRTHVSFMPDKRIAVGVLVNNDALGGFLADMLAAYAYDWWLGTENFEVDYAKQVEETLREYESRKQGIAAEAAQRAKREWQLTKPFAEYAGNYVNDLAGTIEIVAMEKALEVRMGRMNAVATPFTAKDTIRVVMTPGGNGEVIGFTMGADGKVSSLNWGGVVFSKSAK